MTVFPRDSIQTNSDDHLLLGGVDALSLAAEYQTPLVVYDVALIRAQIARFKQVFEQSGVAYKISYASKAFAVRAMYQLLAAEHVGCDVVSGGELYTAIKADFPMGRAAFHGNNKSREELELAIDNEIGTIIIDNFYEIDLLKAVLAEKKTTVNVMIRVSPGIHASTHEYITTGQEDSKFGFDLKSGQVNEAFNLISQIPAMTLIGIHCHIGSQIFDIKGFLGAVDLLVKLASDWQTAAGYQMAVLNVGGGFGIRYTDEDEPMAPEAVVSAIIDEVKLKTTEAGLAMPAIWIEPGRALVGEAGTSLYTIGSRKDIPEIRTYLAVDGGMGDNIRPALYQAKYSALLANQATAEPKEIVSIAGKYCESGDMLIWDLPLPKSQPGDILAVFSTGAYGYSMASNYNRNPRPAVVFVEDGHADLVVKRETYAQLIQNDLLKD